MIRFFRFYSKLLGLFSIFHTGAQVAEETFSPTIPAEYWANKELYHQDVMAGVPAEQILKNLRSGKYCISQSIIDAYPVPHRDPSTGKIIVENSELYHEDLLQYSGAQVMKWMKQGRYNLTAAELEVEQLRIKKQFEKQHIRWPYSDEDKRKIEEIDAFLATRKIYFRNTEAVRQWRKAQAADSSCTRI